MLRLTEHLTSNKLVNPHLSVFCKRHSIGSAPLYIHDHLINATGSQQLSCLRLLDLSTAFDTISRMHLILILVLYSSVCSQLVSVLLVISLLPVFPKATFSVLYFPPPVPSSLFPWTITFVKMTVHTSSLSLTQLRLEHYLPLFHDLLLRSYLYHCVWSVITVHNLTPEKCDNNYSPHHLTPTSCLRNNIQLITGISRCCGCL